MITDCHSHLGSIYDKDAMEFWNKNHRISDRVTDAFFKVREWVDRSIVVAFPGGPHIDNNECIASFAREHSDKVVPFFIIDPKAPSCLSDIQRAVDEWGAKGVKLAPIYQSFKPDDEKYFPVYEKLQKLGLPISWFQGSSFEATQGPLEWANPVLLDKVARTFPGLKMVVGHLGFPWFRETIALIKKHANVYTDVSACGKKSWMLYNALVEAIQYGTEEKIFFGSEYPMFTPDMIREGLIAATTFAQGTSLPSIPTKVIDDMLARDVCGCLGIKWS